MSFDFIKSEIARFSTNFPSECQQWLFFYPKKTHNEDLDELKSINNMEIFFEKFLNSKVINPYALSYEFFDLNLSEMIEKIENLSSCHYGSFSERKAKQLRETIKIEDKIFFLVTYNPKVIFFN